MLYWLCFSVDFLTYHGLQDVVQPEVRGVWLALGSSLWALGQQPDLAEKGWLILTNLQLPKMIGYHDRHPKTWSTGVTSTWTHQRRGVIVVPRFFPFFCKPCNFLNSIERREMPPPSPRHTVWIRLTTQDGNQGGMADQFYPNIAWVLIIPRPSESESLISMLTYYTHC